MAPFLARKKNKNASIYYCSLKNKITSYFSLSTDTYERGLYTMLGFNLDQVRNTFYNQLY